MHYRKLSDISLIHKNNRVKLVQHKFKESENEDQKETMTES